MEFVLRQLVLPCFELRLRWKVCFPLDFSGPAFHPFSQPYREPMSDHYEFLSDSQEKTMAAVVADAAVLKPEVICNLQAEASTQLAAQLQTVIAADARTIQLSNITIALSVFCAGAAIQAFGEAPLGPLFWGALIALLILVIAAGHFAVATRPGRKLPLPGRDPITLIELQKRYGDNFPAAQLGLVQIDIEEASRSATEWAGISFRGLMLLLSAPLIGGLAGLISLQMSAAPTPEFLCELEQQIELVKACNLSPISPLNK
jgi:hypothetical protein